MEAPAGQVSRAQGDVHWNPESDGPGFWSVLRHADITTVSKDPTTYSSAFANGGHRIFNEHERGTAALGATAIEGLLGKTAGITQLRGKWQAYRGIPLMPTFHPAYLLRNPADKAKAWADLCLALQHAPQP